jgi:hypothetical protein
LREMTRSTLDDDDEVRLVFAETEEAEAVA